MDAKRMGSHSWDVPLMDYSSLATMPANTPPRISLADMLMNHVTTPAPPTRNNEATVRALLSDKWPSDQPLQTPLLEDRSMSPANMAMGLLGAPGLRGMGGAMARSVGDFSKAWEGRGISNVVSDLPSRSQIELNKVVVPQNQRGQGIGSSFMKELTELADSQGRTLTLSPSTDFGGSSVSRLKEFYKRFGFIENAGRNKDFTISNSMYRPPSK